MLYATGTAEATCQNAAANNGNLQHILEENGGQQNFSYDSLNRLTSAYSANRPTANSYNFAYGYDSFGNMLPTDNLHGNPTYSRDPQPTNRIKNGSDITYYPNGTIQTANSHSFWYTAEGYVRSIDNYSTGSYLYNALGERTLSVRNDQPWNNWSNYSWSENVYLGGQPMAEMHVDAAGAQPTWTNYIYANGQRIARLVGLDPKGPTVNYYLDDHLGTAQMELAGGWHAHMERLVHALRARGHLRRNK